MDNWFVLGFVILFLPILIAGAIAAAVALWLMWAIAISIAQDVWRQFFGR
jgi:hypothetical protein